LKKIFCFCFIILFTLLFCSCGENMKALLEYQALPISARVKICDEKGEYDAIITVENENMRRVKLYSPENLSGVEIVFSNGKKQIFCNGIEISLSLIDKENDKIYQYTELFCISPSGQWKITQGEHNTGDVYICDNGKIVAYISKNPNYPCKFDMGNATVEIIEIIK